MSDFAKALLLRFIRIFVSGMLAQMAIAATTVPVSQWSDFNNWFPAVLVAGVTGGLAALDKMMRFEDR